MKKEFLSKRKFREYSGWYVDTLELLGCKKKTRDSFLEDVLEFVNSKKKEFIPSETQNFRICGNVGKRGIVFSGKVEKMYRDKVDGNMIYVKTVDEVAVVYADECVDLLFTKWGKEREEKGKKLVWAL